MANEMKKNEKPENSSMILDDGWFDMLEAWEKEAIEEADRIREEEEKNEGNKEV